MKKFLVFLVLFFAFSLGKTKAVLASGRLYLDPATGSYSIGDQFDVSVMADPGTSQIVAIDGLINYDNTRLEVVKVEEAVFFKDDTGTYQGFSYSNNADTGRISIYSFATTGNFSVTTAGKIATVTFKATTQGEAAASFVCQAGSSEDSSMWDTDSEDAIDCGTNGSGTYTIGAATGPTNTPTPVPTTASTAPDSPTATPSELPQSGVELPLLIVLLGGGFVLGAGLLVRFV
jgi:hypothetical protein